MGGISGAPRNPLKLNLMSQILPIGDFLPVDAEGYLINPCRKELIVPPWSDVVTDIKVAYLQNLTEKLHSLYLRGSVAKGTAIAEVSDIDTFAVIFMDRQKMDRSWIAPFRQRMAVEYPFQKGIEIGFVSYDAVCNSQGTRGSRFTIKTQSVCLWGEDLAPSIPSFKPGRDLVGHAYGIKEDIRQVVERLPSIDESSAIKGLSQWIMKRLVRTGFELVMEQERAYTRDLYPCYVAFSKHYPAQEQPMKHALEWAIAPSDNKAELARFLDVFGTWIVNTVTETFHTTKAGDRSYGEIRRVY
jgi:uncharacterized protein